MEHGPLVEPYAVGLHTARIAGIEAGDRVLIVGGGPVGLTTAAWARQLGAGDITVSDPVALRRDARPRSAPRPRSIRRSTASAAPTT